MLPLQAADTLARLLEARGVELERERDDFACDGHHAQVAWAAFLEMAALPAYEPFRNPFGATLRADPDHDGDMLLFEVTSGRGGETSLVFTRQFSFEGPDEGYHGMNALTMFIEGLAATDVRSVTMWGRGGPAPDDDDQRNPHNPSWFGHVRSWARAVEATDEFKAVVQSGAASRVEAAQSDI